MNAKYKILSIVVLLALAGLACGQLNIGIESSTETSEVGNADISLETVDTNIEEPPQGEENTSTYAQYWKVVEDTRTGVRFAIPCFWDANIPAPGQDPTGLGSFSVANYTEAFISSLGFKSSDQIWGIGGAKFDLGYVKPSQYGLPASASLQNVASAMYANMDDSQLGSLTPITINGQAALQVDTTSDLWGPGRFYLFGLGADLVLMINPYPFETNFHPDFDAILQSFAVTADKDVQIPDQMPADPPDGMGAACIGVASPVPTPTTAMADLEGTLDCNTVTDEVPLMWVECNVQASFISRNTQPLPGYMGSEFLIGYWQSEGQILTRDQAMMEIENALLPPNTGNLTFTTDRALFPPLAGMQPEDLFSPDANIVEVVYSEGWGKDGSGAAFLIFSTDQNGDPYFYGMLVSWTHFDM